MYRAQNCRFRIITFTSWILVYLWNRGVPWHGKIRQSKTFFIFSIFFLPFLFVYKNLCIISSSIKKFFISTKTFILSKTEQNYIFHRILFSGHWSKKSFLYPFRSLSSKLFRKVKNSFSMVKLFKKFKRFKGCKGCKLFSLSFLFYFPFLWKCIYVQIFFHYRFYFYFPFLWKCINIHKNLD